MVRVPLYILWSGFHCIYCGPGFTVYIVVRVLLYILWSGFLAPPAERQRSFSNADSSVVVRRRRPSSVVNFSIKSLISQKLSDNFFSFLACSFLRMVPMHSKNMDVV